MSTLLNPPFIPTPAQPNFRCKLQAQIRYGDGSEWGEPGWYGYADDPVQGDDNYVTLSTRSYTPREGSALPAYWTSPEMVLLTGVGVYDLIPWYSAPPNIEDYEGPDYIYGSQMRYRLHPNFYRALPVKLRWSSSTEEGSPITLTIPTSGWSDFVSGGQANGPDDLGSAYYPDQLEIWCGHFLTLSPF